MEETKMKKIISIAFAAILAGLAISCQKEEFVSDKTDAVQYTFNITVNDRAGFDNDASTKGSEYHKSYWEKGDKIFLFFRPTDDNLLNTYATLTYDGSEWGVNAPGLAGLGEGGTLSAVYVYNLGSSVEPDFSDDDKQWTIKTGNTFYNCQTGVDYTVSDNVISASLDSLVAPTNFVQFYVEGATGALTCDNVKGWKNIAIGSDMTFSNVTCTGYMEGLTNSGDSKVKEYYGRIVNNGTSLKDQYCKFSVVKGDKVYEHAATPPSEARSFKMDISDGYWQEAKGKLPGLFTVGKGADGKAGTADDVQVRFSQGNLWYGPATEDASATFNFEKNQYDSTPASDSSWRSDHISHFYWNQDASLAYAVSNNETGATDNDNFFTNATETTAKTDFTVNGQTNVWRTLSHDEWKYLFKNHTYKYVSVNGKHGIVIAPDGFSGTIEDSDVTDWATAESNGFVFLPNTGFRNDGTDISQTDISCFYWTSTALGKYEDENKEEDCYFAYRVFFQWKDSSLDQNFDSKAHREWAIGVRLVTNVPDE